MTTDLLPDALREAVGDELQPVRPLSPAWQRTLVVATLATTVAVIAIGTVAFRFDLGQIPMWLSWGCSALELLVGIFIVGLALREAVPGSAIPTGALWTAVSTGLVLQIVVGLATWMHSPGMQAGDGFLAHGIGCMTHDAARVLPIFAVTAWLVFRALPLRAPVAGLLGGVGAAMAGDAITHLLCPMSDMRHVLVWHTGAILGFMALGWAVGYAWQRIRWR
jgi:hypothetical protein